MLYSQLLPQSESLSLLSSLIENRSDCKIPFVAIDTETTGKNVRDNRDKCMGISIAWMDSTGELHAMYMPFFHLWGVNYDWNLFKGSIQHIVDTLPVVFHNFDFDVESLNTIGIDAFNSNFFDTMLLSHHLNENLFSQGLNNTSQYWINDPGKKDYLAKYVKILGWSGIPSEMMCEYGAYDAHLTFRLFRHLWQLIVKEGLVDDWNSHRRDFIRTLISMERNGIGVDVDLCNQLTDTGESRMEAVKSELGLDPGKRNDLKTLLIDNLKLPEIYNPKTKNITFDKKAMEFYDEALAFRQNPVAQRVLEFRGWQKSVSSNYRSYVNLLSPDGKLRCHYWPHGTKTRRLSCREPNLQQIPRSGVKPWNGRMKKCFIPTEGFTLVEFDYSQLEFRLGAAVAKERNLLEIFNAIPERDIFDEMSKVLGLSRDHTKTQVYATSYGAGEARIAGVFGISLREAKERIENFRESYPRLRKASVYYGLLAKQNSRVPIWSGRFRHFEKPEVEAHKAFNSAIQGGAADIVERTGLRLARAGFNNGTDSRMNLQIHDAYVLEIRTDLLKEMVPIAKKIMSAVNEDHDFGVRFPVDAHVFGTKEKL